MREGVSRMKMLTFTFLGTSSGVPTLSRNVSGLAIRLGPSLGWLLVDAGDGTQQRLQIAGFSLHDLRAIAITHSHGDHCYGLPGLLASAGMASRREPLVLICHDTVWEWVQATIRCTDLHLPYELQHVPVTDTDAAEVWQHEGVRITSHVLLHRVPSVAYRVEVTHRQVKLLADALRAQGLPAGEMWKALQRGHDVTHEGTIFQSAQWTQTTVFQSCIVVGGDNARPALLHQACQGAQVLIHESTYTQDILEKVGPGPMHSSAEDVALFAQSAGVPHLVLTHFSPRHHSQSAMAVLQAEALRAYTCGQLWMARDFQVYTLMSDGTLQCKEPDTPDTRSVVSET